MTYSILRMIELMDEEFPLLLNSIMNRIPILVTGRDYELVDDMVESLTQLCPHRHKLVFWRDFTSESEIMAVWEEEKHDYEVSRTVVCCLTSNLKLALERINQFTGWILGIPLGGNVLGMHFDKDALQEVTTHTLQKSPMCGVLRLDSPSSMSFELINGTKAHLM